MHMERSGGDISLRDSDNLESLVGTGIDETGSFDFETLHSKDGGHEQQLEDKCQLEELHWPAISV